MEPSSRDRISVDLHGLKAPLMERALAVGLSPSHLVRQVLADALGRPAPLNAEVRHTPAQTDPAARTRLCLRMRSDDAAATLQAAQRAGMATGDYVAALVAGVPVVLDGGGRAQTLQALTASTDELAHFGHRLYQLNALLRRGDVEPQLALEEIGHTVERATELANQMLALAKVEQLRQDRDAPVVDWADVVRAVGLDLSPLIAEHALDFSLDVVSARVRAHEWALRELSRNLLHNAIKNTPEGSRLAVTLVRDAHAAALTISDSGPGISATLREHLFQPFATDPQHAGASGSGSGLGLAICHGITLSLGGSIDLVNRETHGQVQGLDATVRLPLATT